MHNMVVVVNAGKATVKDARYCMREKGRLHQRERSTLRSIREVSIVPVSSDGVEEGLLIVSPCPWGCFRG